MSATVRDGVCFQYAKSGTCNFGATCKFSHDVPRTRGSPRISRRSKKLQRVTRRGQPRSNDHIDNFFEEYAGFEYERTAPIWSEFNRMCNEFDWDSDDFEMREARRDFKGAMVQQFNDVYGTDADDLSAWQELCHVLNIDPVPEELKECREVRAGTLVSNMNTELIKDPKRVLQTHVNLVDLVDTPRTGAPVEVFPTLKSLQSYTIEEEKYFPKEDAYAGGLLRYLLREILNPYGGGQKKARRRT